MITSRLRKVFEDPNSADHCCYTEGVSLSRRELQGTSRLHSHRKGLVVTQATQAQIACSRRSDSGARAKNKASERAGKKTRGDWGKAQNKKIPEKRDSCLIAHLEVLCYNGLNYRDSYGNATDLF